MIRKQGNWVHYDLKPRFVERRFLHVNNCFIGKKKVFFIASWRVMKNGFITATQREEIHRDCPVMLIRRRLGRIFTLRRLCCVFGGIRPVLFIMCHITSRGTKKWFHSMTTLGLTLPNLLKPTRKRSNGKSYPTHRNPQILRHPIITCSSRWHMVWMISSSAHMKTSKNVLIRE